MSHCGHTLQSLLHWILLSAPDIDETCRITGEKKWEWFDEVDDLNFACVCSDGLIVDYPLIVPNRDSVITTTCGYQTQIVGIISRDYLLLVAVDLPSQF